MTTRRVWAAAVVFFSAEGKTKTRDAVALSHGGWWLTCRLLILFHVCVYKRRSSVLGIGLTLNIMFFYIFDQTFQNPKAALVFLLALRMVCMTSWVRPNSQRIILFSQRNILFRWSASVFQWSFNCISEVTFKFPWKRKYGNKQNHCLHTTGRNILYNTIRFIT